MFSHRHSSPHRVKGQASFPPELSFLSRGRRVPPKLHLTFFPLIQETVIGLSALSLAVLGPAGWFLFHLPSYKKNSARWW
uniref:Uncharacterized protein n=1 Tax=Chelonoidis abingdonii TaxID=106734 RepID=A0A8C0IWA9_CHEAB